MLTFGQTTMTVFSLMPHSIKCGARENNKKTASVLRCSKCESVCRCLCLKYCSPGGGRGSWAWWWRRGGGNEWIWSGFSSPYAISTTSSALWSHTRHRPGWSDDWGGGGAVIIQSRTNVLDTNSSVLSMLLWTCIYFLIRIQPEHTDIKNSFLKCEL